MEANLNSSILLEKLKIYQWIFSFFGLNFPPFLLYRLQRDLKFYIFYIVYILYSLLLLVGVLWAANVHNFIVKRATEIHHLDLMTEILTYIQNIMMAILQLLMEYKACFCYQKLLEILWFMRNLEFNMLTAYPAVFKTNKLSQRLLYATGFSLIILVSFLILLNYYLVANNMAIRDKLLVVFFLMSVQLKFLEYGIYVQLIYEYLQTLLKSLKCLKERLENDFARTLPLMQYYQKCLRKNQESLMQIWYLIYKLEKYFGYSIFLLFFYNVIVILCTVNWAYVQYLYETDSIYQMVRLLYIIILLLNMLLLCSLTQQCINKYEKFSQNLLRFQLYPHDVQMIMTIKEYSLQLMHHSIKFSCNGYMDIDLSYFGKTTLVIFFYAIILIQFKLTDLSEGAIKATKYIFGQY